MEPIPCLIDLTINMQTIVNNWRPYIIKSQNAWGKMTTEIQIVTYRERKMSRFHAEI